MSKINASVRDLRKLETLAQIHDAARQLALADGLSSVKIEDIASKANISRRTFFNYFPSKEDAVLGLQSPTLPNGAVERFENSNDDIITRTVRLVVEVTRTTTVANSTAKGRRKLRKHFPELIERFEFRTKSVEKIIQPIVEDCLSRDGVKSPAQEAVVILSLSAAIFKLAYRIDHEIKDESVTKSIKTFKDTLKKRL